MGTDVMEQDGKAAERRAKPYKGMGMEGAVARSYAKSTARTMEDYTKEARRAAALLAPRARVLEVAPGPGYFSIELARLGDYRIVGLDISKTFLEIARQNAVKAGVRVDFRHGSASDMPLPDNHFDLIFCRAAFKNFSEPVRALQEMCRVLKPGGVAVIIDLRRDASRQEIREGISRMDLGFIGRIMTRLTFRFILLKRAYTKREFEAIAAETPFTDVRIDESGIGMEIRLKK